VLFRGRAAAQEASVLGAQFGDFLVFFGERCFEALDARSQRFHFAGAGRVREERLRLSADFARLHAEPRIRQKPVRQGCELILPASMAYLFVSPRPKPIWIQGFFVSRTARSKLQSR
jgi:hypothetical protein